MSEDSVKRVLERVDAGVRGYYDLTGESVSGLSGRVDAGINDFRVETSLSLSRSEAKLSTLISYTYEDAEFHLLRAYYHASPSLIVIILAIASFVATVIEVINTINGLFKIITGENLVYWINRLIPGFADIWNGMMNKISEVSSVLGWGVDGVHHLMNILDAGSHAVGSITGKDIAWTKLEKFKNAQNLVKSLSGNLSSWQKDPGSMINNFVTVYGEHNARDGGEFMAGLVNMSRQASDKVNELTMYTGRVFNEFNGLFMDMPEFIANHIPQYIRDAVTWADTMINDRLLPALDTFKRRIDEIDTLIDKQRADMGALAGRIARPGDLLGEIDKLPDFVRKDQEDKISEVSGRTLKRVNESDMATSESRLREFDKVYAALAAHSPEPEFLSLESPARAAVTGIIAEPRETWFAGDF